MSEGDKIPVTVSILTRNNADTLPRALESVKDFSDILICDGGSTDGTLDMAQKYGARVIQQSKQFLDDEGRIMDYAGVRNQTLDAAREKWFFFLDSDEYISPELIKAIAAAIRGPQGAYAVRRLRVINGEIVTCDITYPNRQVRLFARSAATRFTKPVHERIGLASGVVPGLLDGILLVPWDYTPSELRRKWSRYIELEVRRFKPISARIAWRVTYSNFKAEVLYAGRLVRNRLLCRGKRVPFAVECMWFWYHAYYTLRIWSAWLMYDGTTH